MWPLRKVEDRKLIVFEKKNPKEDFRTFSKERSDGGRSGERGKITS